MSYESIMDFINFLKQIGLIAIGAIIPTISTYFSSNRRERSIVKIHIQARASEELLDNIKKYLEILQKNKFSLSILLKKYNTSLVMVKELEEKIETDVYETNMLNEIFKTIEECKFSWSKYIEIFNKLITNLETKEVIFHKMIGYKDLLFEENNNINKIYNNIINLYHIDMYDNIIKMDNVNEKSIILMKEYEDEFEAKKKDICNYIYDLRVATQNEYLRKLFRYKVPYRQPLPGEVPVYKAGFKYNDIEK